jgi:hypothetical protein
VLNYDSKVSALDRLLNLLLAQFLTGKTAFSADSAHFPQPVAHAFFDWNDLMIILPR